MIDARWSRGDDCLWPGWHNTEMSIRIASTCESARINSSGFRSCPLYGLLIRPVGCRSIHGHQSSNEREPRAP